MGFSFDLARPHRQPDRPVRVSLRLTGCDAELLGGPFLAGGDRSFIAQARRLAWRVHADAALDDAERSVLQAALAQFIAGRRSDEERLRIAQARVHLAPTPLRFSVVVPVYRDVAVTQACIDSVLAHRDETAEALVLVNDASPDDGMAEMLAAYAALPLVQVLTNRRNLGFVQTANRGLQVCGGGDVVLLNSDTRVFAGGLREIWAAGRSAPEIGSVTALSNNATIFSYPGPEAACAALTDIGWAEVAAVALAGNAGRVVDVPTGHGFCLLLKREMLDRVGGLDEAFGRGYGEENDLCLRSSDLGWRHVAAAGAFVEHRKASPLRKKRPICCG